MMDSRSYFFSKPITQLFRYLVTGGSSALVDWSIYWIAIQVFNTHYLAAGFISFTIAVSLNYYLSAYWVFVHNEKRNRTAEIGLVFLVSFIGLLVNQFCLLFLVEVWQLHYMWAKIFATGIVFFWNFFIRKYYVFKIK